MSAHRKRPVPLPTEWLMPERDGSPPPSSAMDAERELTHVREELAEQARETTRLNAKLALMARRERELRELLLDAHDQLLRRDEELQATLAAALQRQPTRAPVRVDGVASGHLRYKALVQEIRAAADASLPADVTVAVVSRGDDELLELGPRTGWHFPQTNEGLYVGYHPRDSASAIEHVEELRSKGAQYLLLPATAFWWLEHYAEFAQHLERSYRRLDTGESCAIFAFDAGPTFDYGSLVARLKTLVDGAVPGDATVAVISRGDDALLELNGRPAWHFPRGKEGGYAGYYPRTSRAVVRHLAEIRSDGATHLVIPATAFWWLNHYDGLRRHLERNSTLAARQEGTGAIFALAPKRRVLWFSRA